MVNYTTEEGWHTLPDDHKVYTKVWVPKTPPIAILLFVHGFSDHINIYNTLFPTLACRGVQTHAFDQRGWGRSVHTRSDRGLTGPTSTVLNDITSVLKSLIPMATGKGLLLFLMGHSMGGAEILQYAARGPAEVRAEIRGYLAESPYIALHPSLQPWRCTIAAGRLVAKVAPKRQMVRKLDSKSLSRDSNVCNEWANDELCHDTGTLEGVAGMLERGEELDRDMVVVKEGQGQEGVTRIWVGHGNDDRVTSYDTSKRWVERLAVEDKQFKTYTGWYHKLHAEPGEDKIIFANDVADWILARTGSETRDASVVKSKL